MSFFRSFFLEFFFLFSFLIFFCFLSLFFSLFIFIRSTNPPHEFAFYQTDFTDIPFVFFYRILSACWVLFLSFNLLFFTAVLIRYGPTCDLSRVCKVVTHDVVSYASTNCFVSSNVVQ